MLDFDVFVYKSFWFFYFDGKIDFLGFCILFIIFMVFYILVLFCIAFKQGILMMAQILV